MAKTIKFRRKHRYKSLRPRIRPLFLRFDSNNIVNKRKNRQIKLHQNKKLSVTNNAIEKVKR